MIIIFLNNLLAGSKTLKFQPRSIFMTRTLGALKKKSNTILLPIRAEENTKNNSTINFL